MRCPQLKGKPKLFILQACQGRDLNAQGRIEVAEHSTENGTERLTEIPMESPRENSNITAASVEVYQTTNFGYEINDESELLLSENGTERTPEDPTANPNITVASVEVYETTCFVNEETTDSTTAGTTAAVPTEHSTEYFTETATESPDLNPVYKTNPLNENTEETGLMLPAPHEVIEYTIDAADIVKSDDQRYHDVADTAEFWACAPGNNAFRSHDLSYFIKIFCNTMDRLGMTMDFYRIVNEVNQKMRNSEPLKYTYGGVRYDVRLVSHFEGSLTNDVRFCEDPKSCLSNQSKSLLKLIIPLMLFLLLAVPLGVYYLPCTLNSCDANALCINNFGSYTCECNSTDGFFGNGTFCTGKY